MKADNHSEGGIFALYALVKHCGKALIVPAIASAAPHFSQMASSHPR